MSVPSRAPRVRRALAMVAVAALALSGCATPNAGADGNYARPFGDSLVTPNPTPYSKALVCMAEYARANNLAAPRIAVGRINDLTGKLDDNGGRTITQGAMLMAISALGKAGIPVVERYETDVPKLEYNLANNKLIARAGAANPGVDRDYRPVYPGQVSGSDYFLTGGITELNNNIRTTSGDAAWTQGARQAGTASGGIYVLNVAIDLRLVDTTTLDVVDMISYQKQIVGKQVGAGLYAFFGNNVVNVSGGTSGEEPVHLAVRSLVERAVLEFVSNLYRAPGPQVCLGEKDDLLRADSVGPDAGRYGS